MTSELLCNLKTCRKVVTGLAWVTSCSHIFCDEDGSRKFRASLVCPACEADLAGDYDAVRVNLNPTEQYKSMVLAGFKPEICLEICSRAIHFWTYQVHQETIYQQYVCDKSKEKLKQVEKFCDEMTQKTNNQVEQIKIQLKATRKSLDAARKREAELLEKINEKNLQYQKLLTAHEAFRRKNVTPATFERASMHPTSQKVPPVPSFHMTFANDIHRQQSEQNSKMYADKTDNEAFIFRPTSATGLKKSASFHNPHAPNGVRFRNYNAEEL